MAGDLAVAGGAATWNGKGAVWLALFLGMSISAPLRANNLRGPAVTMEILETQNKPNENTTNYTTSSPSIESA